MCIDFHFLNFFNFLKFLFFFFRFMYMEHLFHVHKFLFFVTFWWKINVWPLNQKLHYSTDVRTEIMSGNVQTNFLVMWDTDSISFIRIILEQMNRCTILAKKLFLFSMSPFKLERKYRKSLHLGLQVYINLLFVFSLLCSVLF